ncbi:hypothetical protein SLPG_00031 [Salicola phage CGphi29]|uniref:hypothetical protein n=1 Tax=Salicola phage CGphi29 TaxID=754067 RepID=UPI0002C11FDF|nr:hypothetical protein SLPG_00031 [Salicola phage CGphi29]AGH31825.1 hypothetical protein SLPG_00031 [Salicola phage CGphi29]
MAKTTSTGTKFSIVADTPATLDQAGYEALTYTEVGEVVDLPEYGPNVQVVESNPLATGITQKFKGFVNQGSQSVGLEYDSEDAGQQILDDAVSGPTKNDEHSVKIEYQDGSVDYYTCRVFSYTKNPGSANSMVGSTAQVEINSPVVKVAAP